MPSWLRRQFAACVVHVIVGAQIAIAVAWGGAHIGQRPKTHVEDTWGLGLRLQSTVSEDT